MIACLRRRAALLPALLIALGCASSTGTGGSESDPEPELGGGRLAIGADPATFYQQAGLLAGTGAVSFVGTLHFLATDTSDTTLMLLGVSIPNRALTFIREDDRFRAGYEVRATLRRGGVQIGEVSAREQVRVGSFMETERADESVIFQEFVPMEPGSYVIQLVVRDLESARISSVAADISIPRYFDGRLASPVPVHEVELRDHLDSLPALISRPRATGIFGRDSTIAVYVEAYGGEDAVPVEVVVRGDDGAVVHQQTLQLPRTDALFAGTVRIPVAPLGIGPRRLSVTRADTRDSSFASVVVTFDENLPLLTFDDMLDYLQYFSSISRLRELRTAPPTDRARIWGEFLEDTDPDPSTPENEALRSYFERVTYANVRFREDEGTGWRSDRGMVFVALGEPDQILESTRNQFGQRGRRQVWEYQRHRLQLVFVDETGFGRWRLTTSSEVEFRSALARARGG